MSKISVRCILFCILSITLNCRKPLSGSLAAKPKSPSNSIVISTSNYDSIKEGLWIIKHYASWCKHSKSLAPIWTEFADYYAKEYRKNKIYIGEIQCDASESNVINNKFSQGLCDKHKIAGYPTVIIYHQGIQIKEYTDSYSLELMNDFVINVATKLDYIVEETNNDIESVEYKKALENPQFNKQREIQSNINDLSKSLDVNELIQITNTPKDEIWFIKFYSTTCEFSKQIEPVWLKLGETTKGKIKLGEFNCLNNLNICQKEFNIKKTPTMRLYSKDKNKYEEIVGYHELAGLYKMAMQYVEPSSSVVRLENLQDIQKSTDYPQIVYYDTFKYHNDNNFNRLKILLKGTALPKSIYYTRDINVLVAYSSEQDNILKMAEKNDFVLFIIRKDSKDKSTIVVADPEITQNREMLRSFVKHNMYPLVIHTKNKDELINAVQNEVVAIALYQRFDFETYQLLKEISEVYHSGQRPGVSAKGKTMVFAYMEFGFLKNLVNTKILKANLGEIENNAVIISDQQNNKVYLNNKNGVKFSLAGFKNNIEQLSSYVENLLQSHTTDGFGSDDHKYDYYIGLGVVSTVVFVLVYFLIRKCRKRSTADYRKID